MQLFLFFAVSSLIAHALLLHGNPGGQWTLTAIAADLVLAVFLASLGQYLLRWHRIAMIALVAIFSCLLIANMESIVALEKGIDLRDLRYALDPAFLAASASHPGFPLFTALLALGAVLVSWKQQRLTQRPGLVLGSMMISGVLLIPAANSSWQNTQIVVPGMVRAIDDTSGDVAQGKAPGLQRELDGESILGSSRARNIVLLVLEGIPGEAIDGKQISMPELAGIASQASVAQSLYTHSHQTIRGLYSLLCGDYSKLSLDVTKASEYLQLPAPKRPRCLPGALADAGFQTSYLQAARLAYMGKDVFMPAIGFKDVRGEESLPLRYADSGWGPDDKAFLEQAAESIGKLHQQSQPFFITLLTAGTHHPYTLPTAERGDNPKLDAVRYLDAALPAFWQSLQELGVWDDTLLVITSDESHAGNRGLWLARGPGVPAEEVRGVYGLLDLPLSLLDYLDIAHQYPQMGGRSLFRRYRDSRPLLYYGDYLYAFNTAGERMYCESEQRCFRDDGSGPVLTTGAGAGELHRQLQGWGRQADASLRIGSRAAAWNLIEDRDTAVATGKLNILAAGKYLDLPAGQQLWIGVDANYRGSGSVELRLNLLDSEAGNDLLQPPKLPILKNGERVQLQLAFVLDESVTAAHPTLVAPLRDGAGVLHVERFYLEPGYPLEEQGAHSPMITLSKLKTSIGHGAGRWQGMDYTNSVEALSANHARFPMMEIDLSLTSDNKLVCLHNWGLGYGILFGKSTDQPVSLQQFLNTAVPHQPHFQPCSEATLPALLSAYPDLRLVIDSWSDTRAVMERLLEVIPGAGERIVPQAYDPNQVLEFKAKGYHKVIWTIYRYEERENISHVVEEAMRVKPYAVTLPLELVDSGLIEALLEAGTRVYVHTVNDCETATALWSRGVSLYSDHLQNGDCQSVL
jgi:glycerophosphoryl diester phosphodiesterase